MPADAFEHHVFVDLENVPEVDLSLIAGKPAHVTVLIGKNQAKLPTTFSLQLHHYARQVRPIEVGASGRNALDLTLACHLGQALGAQRTGHFHIVSRDHDFDAMIAHLAASGVSIRRSEAFAQLPFLSRAKSPAPKKSAVPTTSTANDRCARIIDRLKNPANRNRPSSRGKLNAYIKASLGKTASDSSIAECVGKLERDRILSIDAAGKVTWQI